MKNAILVIVPTFLLLLFGGLGFERNLIQVIGLILALISVLFVYLKNKKISLPYGFSYFLVFLLLALLTQIWSLESQNGIEYLFLFAAGGLFWLFFYNLKTDEKFTEIFGWSLTILGISFALIFLTSLLFEKKLAWSFSLVAPYTSNHHHLGDFWVLPLLFLLDKVTREKKRGHFLLILLGFVILFLSLSRSSYVALFVGAAVLFKNQVSAKAKKILLTVSIILLMIFFLASLSKTTLFSRIYFLQGIAGVLKYPLGVGLGNFAIVSKELSLTFTKNSIFSLLAHNLFLEVLIGMGLLGLSFLYWYYRVSQNLLRKPPSKTLFPAIFFALSANFFFDTTYVIPTMFWLWFMSLGLAQKEK